MRRIVFKSVSWRNLNATGANPITITFDTHPRTLIIGENGAGKTTGLDAMSWVLFKRPFRRKAVIDDLLNTTNGKAMWGRVDFVVGDTHWRVERGLKPNSIDIWKDGQPLPSENVKDMQKLIEEEILQIDFKTFCQMVVLGKHYTPFLELSTTERRALVESLWNMEVFSNMAAELKGGLAAISENRKDAENRLMRLGIQLDGKKERIEDAINYARIHQTKVDNCKERLATAKKEHLQALKKIKQHESVEEELDQLRSELQEARDYLTKVSTERTGVFNQIKDAEKSKTCPTCGQAIDTGTSEEHVAGLKKKLDKLNERYELVLNERENLQIQVKGLESKQTEARADEMIAAKAETVVARLEEELEKMQESVGGVDVAVLEREIAEIETAIEEEDKIVDEAIGEEELFKTAISVLKDDAIRSFILSSEVPRMNVLINEFLKKMGLSIKFTMDSGFDESIKARGKDGLSYFSFSEGQKQRIDLAILFAWRQMAMEKASLSTNLLFMDEVLDSSMDDKGCIAFLDQIVADAGEKNNIVIISHRGESIMNKFDRVLRFELRSGFSKMTEVTNNVTN